ncbi:MAG: MnhB domain-containing protein [Caldilineaceae bacterium]
MVEYYLRVLNYLLTPVLLLLSVVLLLRGHDLPGGGFIAGLLAAAAFALQILARGAEDVQQSTRRWMTPIIGIGLLVAVVSAMLGVVFGSAFFEGIWVTLAFGTIKYKIGTPVTFDFGVFLTVLGVSVSFLLGLSQGIVVAPPEAPLPPPAPETRPNLASEEQP